MKTIIRSSTAGAEALRRLSLERPATVLGETSRGVFLRLAPDQVVFLSREGLRGPLTVNVPDLPALSLEPGDAAEIASGQVLFHQRALAVSLGQAQAWQAPQIEVCVDRQLVLDRLRALAAVLLAEKGGAGLSGVLAELVNFPFEQINVREPIDLILPAFGSLQTADVEAAAGHLAGLLGWGSGLTPSGDDFLLGMLLAGSAVARPLQATLAERIIPLAFASTTTLSANLIACAAEGQADERLSSALAGLTGEIFDCKTAAEGLSCWGNSSGLDALAGMAAWFNTMDW